MILALFATRTSCEMPDVGGGDHLLGFATADASGAYRLSAPWKKEFDPVRGRDEVPPDYRLPAGSYYLMAFNCPTMRKDCFVGFGEGTDTGAPFQFKP